MVNLTVYKNLMCFLEYYGVIKSLNSYFIELKITRMTTNVPLDDLPVQRKLCSIKKGSKLYYHTLTSSDIQNTAISKWQYYFHSELSWSIIYL